MLVQNLSEVPHEHLMLASLDKIQSPMFVPLTGVSARFKKKFCRDRIIAVSTNDDNIIVECELA